MTVVVCADAGGAGREPAGHAQRSFHLVGRAPRGLGSENAVHTLANKVSDRTPGRSGESAQRLDLIFGKLYLRPDHTIMLAH